MNSTNELVGRLNGQPRRGQPDGWGGGDVLPLLGGEGRGEGEPPCAKPILQSPPANPVHPVHKPPLSPANWVRPVRPDDLPELERLALADHHAVIRPTHVFLKHGQIVGYVSLAAVALVLPWFDTTQCHAEDSFYFGNMVENLAVVHGHDVLCLPFVASSPFQPFIERLGYQKAGQVELTFKKVS